MPPNTAHLRGILSEYDVRRDAHAARSLRSVPCIIRYPLKIKSIVTVLLITFILASCRPVEKVIPTELPTPGSQSKIPATESITSDWNTYTSELFLVTLKYPADWEISNDGDAAYSGQDGFFQVSASSLSGLTALEMCENDIQLNPSGKVNKYCTNPTLEILQVDHQPACLVLPADDQPPNQRGTSLLVVEYPELERGHTRLLQFSADKNHIRDFIDTLRFVREKP